jgi:zinc transporter 1
MGDALGNIGVIGAALFIWLTTYSWRFYSDPAISLVISVIILTSAWPLCKAASRILLQAAPVGLNLDDVKEDILALHGVVGCHHLHVWQLSDTTMVATLHVRVKFNFEGEGSQEYMDLAEKIRKALHSFGIHSSTIQPEFCSDEVPQRRLGLPEPGTDDESCDEDAFIAANRKIDALADDEEDCLLSCPPECQDENQCCTTTASASGSKNGSIIGHIRGSRNGSRKGSSHGSHDH